MLKAKQIRSIMQDVETSVISSNSSDEEERDTINTKNRRRTSAASEERWAQSISTSTLGPSIWGNAVAQQERGRASRSASFSVGQELTNAPVTNTSFNMSPERERQSDYDQTRVLREQFQQMKFKNRSKSSYAAAWHVPDFEDEDAASDDAVLDDEDLIARLRRGDPPGLRYTTPSNPRLDSLMREKERRASFNNASRPQGFESRSPLHERRESLGHRLSSESIRRDSSNSREQQGTSQPTFLEPTPAYGNMMSDVDRYFSSDDHRTRTRTHLAQTAAAQTALLQQAPSPSPNGPLFIVEFKACRTDVFYVAEGSGLDIHVGDLVIVEADRGRDLGKVTREHVTLAQVKALKAQQARDQALAMGAQDEGEKLHINSQPKLIYRQSQPQEIAMLLIKSQDEQQAMSVCQTKVRQRKLPMEVLDCEYQWDRRKLTFYYYASQRIDFRELVRDLFKMYKTRIWLCAVNPTSVSNANSVLGAPGAIGEPKLPQQQQQFYTGPSMGAQPFVPAMKPGQDPGYIPYNYSMPPQNYGGYPPYMHQQVMY